MPDSATVVMSVSNSNLTHIIFVHVLEFEIPHLSFNFLSIFHSFYSILHEQEHISGMTQFKCKPSSNIWQDFPNHSMSLWFETQKRRQFKFSASTSLTETTTNIPFMP